MFRKLNAKGVVFIEYAPLAYAWVPIVGDNYYYIYCLWVSGEYKGKGYGKQLMEYCLQDAKAKGKSGVCLLGAKKQKAWLTNQAFAKSFGFEVVDTTVDGYELLAKSFDGTLPQFTSQAKEQKIMQQELTIYYSMQCPYVLKNVEIVKEYCKEHAIDVSLIEVTSVQQAKELPCIFNNWALCYKGKFETVNLMLDMKKLERLLQKK